NVVNNFVSGLIVLFERPVRVGDAVQISDVQGEVRRIGIRSSTVRTWDGAEVVVPNSMLVSEKVTNWTPIDRRRRIVIPVNVAYGWVPDEVPKVLAAVAAQTPDLVAAPAPQAVFLGFGDYALRFELRVWTDRLDRVDGLRSEMGMAVYAALRDAGVAIPIVRAVRLQQESPPGGRPPPAAPAELRRRQRGWPTTPPTSQFILPRSVRGKASPAFTRSTPVLSFSGPVNGCAFPAASSARRALTSPAVSAGTAGP